MDEAEFYVGKPLPVKLKQQIEGNEVAASAQRSLIVNQEAEWCASTRSTTPNSSA